MLGFDPLSTAPLASLAADLPDGPLNVITLNSVDRSTFPDVGGESLQISGIFNSGVQSYVELIGPVGAPVAHRCYSARRGQGYHPIPRNGSTIIVATPTLAFGSYDLHVVQGANQGTIPHAVHIVPRVWEQRTFDFRALFSPLIAVGKRKLERHGVLLPGGSLTISPASNAAGTVGVPFSQFVFTTNTLPYHLTWTAVGALPAGLSCNPLTGEISGTPTTPGVSAGLKRRASWALGTQDSNTFSITIT